MIFCCLGHKLLDTRLRSLLDGNAGSMGHWAASETLLGWLNLGQGCLGQFPKRLY